MFRESEITPEQHYVMQYGHKPRFFPDEMDGVPETIKKLANDICNAYQDFSIKIEQNIGKRLKAGMFLLQDYNTKHYTIIKRHIDGPNLKNVVECYIEYKKPKRNSHRKNKTLSSIFREFAEELAPGLIKRNHLFITFDILHGKTTSKFYSKYIRDRMKVIAQIIGVDQK